MGIATKPWNDHNRFNQTGYSASTLMPEPGNYKNRAFFYEDLDRANAREVSHQEFLDDQRADYAEEQWYEDHPDECECYEE